MITSHKWFWPSHLWLLCLSPRYPIRLFKPPSSGAAQSSLTFCCGRTGLFLGYSTSALALLFCGGLICLTKLWLQHWTTFYYIAAFMCRFLVAILFSSITLFSIIWSLYRVFVEYVLCFPRTTCSYRDRHAGFLKGNPFITVALIAAYYLYCSSQ